ncbi:MAG: hypothetical protein KAR20_21670 [Candidatus Heimdallarchaeota archaeon]|nr:hypothetical protein [Candidatus Heimdallarchaeota archaeon]
MEPKEKTFELSVMSDWGDSVVSTGKLSEGNFESTYYSEYEKALGAIREQCKAFVEDENK